MYIIYMIGEMITSPQSLKYFLWQRITLDYLYCRKDVSTMEYKWPDVFKDIISDFSDRLHDECCGTTIYENPQPYLGNENPEVSKEVKYG